MLIPGWITERYRAVIDSHRFWPVVGFCNAVLLIVMAMLVLWGVR